MKRVLSWYRSHLGARILGTVFAFVLVAWVLTAYSTVNSERDILAERADALGNAVTRAVAASSIEPLLIQDYPVLKTHVSGVASGSEDIRYLFIERQGGDVVAAWPDNGGGFSNAIKADHLRYRIPIETAGETLGWVVLGLSTESTERYMNSRFRALGISLAAVFVGLAVSLWAFLHGVLARRLKSLRLQAERLGTGSLEAPVSLEGGDDELVAMAKALESMRVGLNDSQNSIQMQNEKLKEMDRLKGEFVAHMSHEIRTPLAALVGYCELLKREQLEPEIRREAMSALVRNSDHLLKLVNDILDISRIDSGRLNVEQIATNAVLVCEEVRQVLGPSADAKGLKLIFDMPSEAEDPVITDPLRLKQIIINLVGNAIKFTRTGTVTVRVRLAPHSRKGYRELTVEVEDTGCGLAEGQSKTIFESFTQADSSMTRRFGGTGLGLPISRHLAELLGGELTVESTWGVGSTFTLSLVLRESATGVATVSSEDKKHTAETAMALLESVPRVLLAEDGLDNQRIVTLMLEKSGVEVTVAENGQLAVDAALSALKAGQPFDLILMDIQMPVMDGHTATRELRSAGYSAPIVALTAHAMADDRRRTMGAGCDDMITKPVKRGDLLRAIERNLRPSTRSSD